MKAQTDDARTSHCAANANAVKLSLSAVHRYNVVALSGAEALSPLQVFSLPERKAWPCILTSTNNHLWQVTETMHLVVTTIAAILDSY